jgi:hypothetical protein
MHNHPEQHQVVHVKGNHYQMGFQHARQVRHLLPAIQKAIHARYAQLANNEPDAAFEAIIQKTAVLLHEIDPATVAMIRGLADGLSLEFDHLLHYNLVTFLRDLLTTRKALAAKPLASPPEGCSTWAARGAATADGKPLLVKNRDFSMEHLPLQLVIRAQPAAGYRYTYITSAGSPGVFVAGFNETGLAVVDTHVASTDVGPGLPTYALSMHILEAYSTVRSALEYLKSMPRLGRNNLLLVDAGSDIALFEIGHRHFGILEAESDLLINTNHFNSQPMQGYFVDTEREEIRGNTLKRYTLLKDRLEKASGVIDISFAQQMMATHQGPLSSICRHSLPGISMESTIATCVFMPAQQQMLFCHGLPCQAMYTQYSYNHDDLETI